MQQRRRPADLTITPRRLHVGIDARTPKYWLDGDPASTHLLNALSITFPRGEQAFVDSVRHFKDAIRDPELARDVRAFITQEMHHSRSHTDFNDWLRELGLPVELIDDDVRRETAYAQRTYSPEVLLAITCALEHFTAVLAHAFLTSPDLLASIHEDVRDLWLWHAIEETEHKAVAFDVYQHVGGRYETRVLTMLAITVMFLYKTSLHHRQIMEADGQLGNVRSWVKGAWRFFGPKGHFANLGPLYRAYFRRDFHPWQHDNRAVLGDVRARLEAAMARSSAATYREAA